MSQDPYLVAVGNLYQFRCRRNRAQDIGYLGYYGKTVAAVEELFILGILRV
jgi:hypothetical protein